MDLLLEKISISVTNAKSLEELAQPLLEMLESVTGLESTYLTVIDLGRGIQKILLARNSGQLNIAEGLEVEWSDTLCKRALESHQPSTSDVRACWGDSQAAQALGLVSYMSAPVSLSDGTLYGTLCAASTYSRAPTDQAVRLLGFFATLISQHVERESLLQKLVQTNKALEASSLTDPLTELPNRRALLQELSRQIAYGERHGSRVLVALLDLDRFKAINDEHGHDVGDQFLIAVARRLRSVLRVEDMAARFGGDEFVIVAPGSASQGSVQVALEALKERLFNATVGLYELPSGVHIAYEGASIGVLSVDPGTMNAVTAIKQADLQMYEAKKARASVASAAK